MIQFFGIALFLIFLFFLGVYIEKQTDRPYAQYKKRRDLLLSKIKKGEVLQGISHGEEVTISRFGLKKAHPEKESTT